MEEEAFNLKEMETRLDQLIVQVFEQGNKLVERTEVQDEKIKKIWAAYTSMEIAEPHFDRDKFNPLFEKMRDTSNDAPYQEIYDRNNDELDRLLGLLKDKNNSMEMLKKTEKVIIELLTLLSFRWDLLTNNLGLVCRHLKGFRDTELLKEEEFKAVEPSLKNTPDGLAVKRSYAKEKERLMRDQMLLFKNEKFVLDQMKDVCDERDRLFLISSGMFLR